MYVVDINEKEEWTKDRSLREIRVNLSCLKTITKVRGDPVIHNMPYFSIDVIYVRG